MLLLSELLIDLPECYDYKVIQENYFDTFALTASALDQKTCIYLDDDKYLSSIQKNVTMVITTQKLAPELLSLGLGICITEFPRILFFMLHNALQSNDAYARKKEATKIGENCCISPLCSIADINVTIGNNITIEEFVVIRENTVIGDNTIIRSGVKIGGEGFEFKHTPEHAILTVKHLGGVIIGNRVEIQYNSCIDKAVYPWDNTIVGDDTKIDNLVHIGHAVKIADNVMVVAQSGIGGRTTIGSSAWIGFAATIINGIHVGENARANIGAVVTKPIADGKSVTGNFAINHHNFINNLKKMNEKED